MMTEISELDRAEITISSLGGCIVHDVVRMLQGNGVKLNPHLWRRPTIALMSEPVTRSRFKLHDLPVEFVNYFVNDYAKLHRSEIENQSGKQVMVFDITRDLFTGVVQMESDSYVMNAADAVGIVDGLTEETMSLDKVKRIVGRDLKVFGENKDQEEFFDVWKIYFVKFIDFLRSNFDQIVMLKLFFTDKLVDGSRVPELVEQADRVNPLLERMYEFAAEHDVPMVELEKEAFVTGHFVSWGGPSLTHFISETTSRLADSVAATINLGNVGSANFRNQAYQRAADAERHLIWLNQEKKRSAELEQMLEQERLKLIEMRRALEADVKALGQQAKVIEEKISELIIHDTVQEKPVG